VLESRLVDGRLTALLAQLGDVHPVACCAGAAGAEVPAARDRLRELIERRLPGCRVIVVHDTRLVLAAAGIDAGIALIAGTGAVAYARTSEGREARRGGWGWMLGDEGGGVWITREAARLVMARVDDGFDVGELGLALLKACAASDARQLLGRMHELREPMEWAALAAVVFATAESDAGSRDIIQRAADALTQLVVPLRKLVDGPVVLAGGLLLNQSRLEDQVRRQVPMRCVRLDQPPVEGAVHLAEELLGR
jgi:N-acetylglucosamine kinase-like BadF-type ATPase